jgi:prepilin-type N-terminal cleavage/methylation domain-containing protein
LEVKKNLQSGVTMIEMLVVATIIAIIAGVSFPALTAGLDSVRLSSASGSAASFLTSTLNRVERREQAAAIVISPKDNLLAVYTAASGEKPERELRMPRGVTIEGDEPRRFLLMPGGTAPRMRLILRNGKGARRSVQIDPTTGVPKVQRVDGDGK